jgi:hypothetical protein
VTANDLLAELRAAGVELKADGDRILVRPAGALTPELRASIQRLKPVVLALLAGHDAEVAWRVEAMRPRVPATGPIPPMYARRLRSVEDGACLSCGEPLTPGNKYHCEPCVHAAWQVLREARRNYATPDGSA